MTKAHLIDEIAAALHAHGCSLPFTVNGDHDSAEIIFTTPDGPDWILSSNAIRDDDMTEAE